MINQLKEAIDRTVKKFQDFPFDFLSERDIQALLFAELRNATSDLRYHYDAEGANRRFGFTGPFSIHPVTTEYYVGPGKLGRFDVAVLSEDTDSKSAIWRQPCRVAIEIKLWQPGYRESKYIKDVEKLLCYQAHLQKTGRAFTGIAMLFVHPCVKEALFKEESGDAYPENGVALHFVTQKDRWSKQFPVPSVPE